MVVMSETEAVQAGLSLPTAASAKPKCCWGRMRVILSISIVSLLLLSGCASLQPPVSGWSQESKRRSDILTLEPPRDGKILVLIGGNATHRGELWIPEPANLATVEDMVGVRPEWASRSVDIKRIGPDGRKTLRIRINKMTRADKEKIELQHGDMIYFVWDRCFGAVPSSGPAASKLWILTQTGTNRGPRA